MTVLIRPFLAVALGAAVFTGCSRSEEKSSTTVVNESTSPAAAASGSPIAAASAAAGSKTIGVSIQNREAQFYQDMEAGMKSEAAKFGYTVSVVDASRDNAKQQSQVEDFISQHVAAIVLTPYDSQAIGSAIVEANKAKVPVFTADIANGSSQGTVVAHIASDNVQGGAQAGKLMCAAVGKAGGSIAIIDEPEVTSVQDRVKGFKSALAANCPAVKVVADIDGGGIVMVSSELPEVLGMAHRVLVIREGRIAGEFARADATPDKIIAVAAGVAA
ncbi:MAG: hypothetical protein NVS4B5_18620 [Vulcanimicrobiaceae bacterium]